MDGNIKSRDDLSIIIHRKCDFIMRVARWELISPSSRDDVVQNAYIKLTRPGKEVWRYFSGKSDEKWKAFIGVSVNNAIKEIGRTMRRDESKQKELIGLLLEDSPEDTIIEKRIKYGLLNDAVETLVIDEHELIIRRFYQMQILQEIAFDLGISNEMAVDRRITRVLGKLRAILEQYMTKEEWLYE